MDPRQGCNRCRRSGGPRFGLVRRPVSQSVDRDRDSGDTTEARGGGEALGEVERITLEQAFELFTVNSARQMGNAARTGSIEPGLLADVLVLDKNPFKIAVTQIHDIRVMKTFINGEIVYDASE